MLKTREPREAKKVAIVEALEVASAAVVAERYNLSRSAVLGLSYRHRQARGLPPTAVTFLSTARTERHQRVVEALRAGTVEEVAVSLGLSMRTVRDVRLSARRAAEALHETPRPPSTVERVLLLTRAAPVPSHQAVALVPTAVPVYACVAVSRVSLLDAAHGQCRSMDDDGLCCSAPVVAGRSWCPSHLARYTQPSRRRMS